MNDPLSRSRDVCTLQEDLLELIDSLLLASSELGDFPLLVRLSVESQPSEVA